MFVFGEGILFFCKLFIFRIHEPKHPGKGFKGGKTHISCAGCVVTFFLKIVEEGEDEITRQALHLKLRALDGKMLGCKGEEECKGIPVCLYGICTDSLYPGQIPLKELFNNDRKLHKSSRKEVLTWNKAVSNMTISADRQSGFSRWAWKRLLSLTLQEILSDNNGNTLTKSSATENISYHYDTLNRLIRVNISDTSGSSLVEYVYDADDIRIQKRLDSNDIINYMVDKNQPFAQVLLETDVQGAVIDSYVYGEDLISQKRGGSTSYYHYDSQASTR